MFYIPKGDPFPISPLAILENISATLVSDPAPNISALLATSFGLKARGDALSVKISVATQLVMTIWNKSFTNDLQLRYVTVTGPSRP